MKSKFISSKVSFVLIIVAIYLIIETGYEILKIQEGIDFKLIFSIIFTILYILYIIFEIIRPYLRNEKALFKLASKYEPADYSDIEPPKITPAVEKHIKTTFEMLRSTKMLELNKGQARYLALQNQINPHFLYNTLESIRSEALISGLDVVADMTESLAVFFRYTISNIENLVSVEDEVENCKTYFKIQKYRFGERLNLFFDYDDEDWEFIRYLKVPKLTIQPILENSIIHGTEHRIGTGNIIISFEVTEKRLIIKVSDDGVGMTEDKLYELNKKIIETSSYELYNKDESKGGIALSNVNNRIHILFGQEYGMHVYSIEGTGTDVDISIPIVRG